MFAPMKEVGPKILWFTVMGKDAMLQCIKVCTVIGLEAARDVLTMLAYVKMAVDLHKTGFANSLLRQRSSFLRNCFFFLYIQGSF